MKIIHISTKILYRIIRKIINLFFLFFERLGFHITPTHFYEPIPDTKDLKDDLWKDKNNLPGINFNYQDQKNLLSLFVSKFKKEYDILSLKNNGFFNIENSEFGPVDAEILYCMVRYFKPRKIVEIGSGYSTNIMIEAILKNKKDFNIDCKLKSIDPYAKDFIKNKKIDFFELISKEVQSVELKEFTDLDENDFLFIDSSHVLKIGSDVQYEYLEVLPQLKAGVIVHSHDIFLPREYPKNWVLKEHRFFNEQYLLQAFLIFNEKFNILWSSSYINYIDNDILINNFNSLVDKTNMPSSFWILKKT